jgi:outer membrane protein
MTRAPRHAAWLLALCALPSATRADGEAVESLSLEQSVALALENNPAVVIERERVRAADAEYGLVRSALLPKISGSVFYNRLDPDRLNPVNVPSVPNADPPELFIEESYAGVRLRQLVLDGSSWLSLGAAGDAIDAQRSSVVASQAETRYAATVAWTRLLVAENLIGVAHEAVKRQLAFEALTDALFQAGKGSRLDKLKAESQRMDAERALLNAQQVELLAQAALRRVLGSDTARPVRAQGEMPGDIAPPPDEDDVVTRAVEHNPQLGRIEAQARQASTALWAAWGAYLPELSVQASYGYRARDVGGEAGEYAAGVFLEVPIFAGLATDSAIKRAESRRREIEASRGAYLQELRLQARAALTDWRIAAESARFAQKLVELNREAAIAASALYESGKATVLDVLTAQADLTRAEGAWVQALGDVATARASVERVTGEPLPSEAQP